MLKYVCTRRKKFLWSLCLRSQFLWTICNPLGKRPFVAQNKCTCAIFQMFLEEFKKLYTPLKMAEKGVEDNFILLDPILIATKVCV